ncbi:hypothetical protein G7Y79_00023g054800 [Physcia stellaris]|nr:hypothetical protein G7Y79_00023g054800 [Physcia stellaris]
MPPRQSEIDHWRKQYEHEVGFFYPDLPVSHIYPEGDILTKRDLTVYRDVEQFVQHIRIKTDIHLEAGLIAHCCFRGAASEWFFGLLDFLQDHLTRDLDALCNRILQKFDTTKQKEEQERLQQQQAEEARIAKEKAEAFACRRCPAKFPSNTKLHQHIQDHHQKKAEKPASETAKPTPTETVTNTKRARQDHNNRARRNYINCNICTDTNTSLYTKQARRTHTKTSGRNAYTPCNTSTNE